MFLILCQVDQPNLCKWGHVDDKYGTKSVDDITYLRYNGHKMPGKYTCNAKKW